MLLNQLFEAASLQERFGSDRKAAHRQLTARGWQATTVPDEYKHPDAPGHSVEVDTHDVTGNGHFAVYRGDRKLAQQKYPPYASHLKLKTDLAKLSSA